MARMTGTYLVADAIQAVGQLPVDLRKTPVDLLACGGQKWLCHPGDPALFTSGASSLRPCRRRTSAGSHSRGPTT